MRYLLMSPCLVLLQTGRPCKEYWEIHLQPYIHYVPVDAELNNLTAAIEWANSNVQHVRAGILFLYLFKVFVFREGRGEGGEDGG